MHRQVGDLRIGSDGIARRGLLVRHLVLPDGISGSREVIDFLASEISPNTRLNIMDQYRPMFHAESDGRLRRRVIRMVVEEARNYALSKGLALISQ
jgi:putative pyruvate formate lyase activating enzyme